MREIRLSEQRINEIVEELKTGRFTGTINITPTTLVGKPKANVYYTPLAYVKTITLINKCDKEIAWHGIVTRNENNFFIEDIVVFPQTVTGTTVQTDDEKYTQWMIKVDDEVFNKMRLHGHSHVNMGVSPSGVDNNYRENIIQNLSENDYYIFLIMNKRGDISAEIYDLENNIIYENKDIEYHQYFENTDSDTWYNAMFNQYVTVPKTVYTQSTFGSVYPNSKNYTSFESYYERQERLAKKDKEKAAKKEVAKAKQKAKPKAKKDTPATNTGKTFTTGYGQFSSYEEFVEESRKAIKEATGGNK